VWRAWGASRNSFKILLVRLNGRDHYKDKGVDSEDNIKIGLREIEFGGVDFIHQDQDTDRWRAPGEHGNKLSGSIKFV
jgi:hypothetical protein